MKKIFLSALICYMPAFAIRTHQVDNSNAKKTNAAIVEKPETLLQAVQQNDVDAVKSFLDFGANPHAKNSAGVSPMSYALNKQANLKKRYAYARDGYKEYDKIVQEHNKSRYDAQVIGSKESSKVSFDAEQAFEKRARYAQDIKDLDVQLVNIEKIIAMLNGVSR